MRHLKKGRKFHRTSGQRKALIKNLAANLILKEKIATTEAKAKEMRPYVEKLITKAKAISQPEEKGKFDGRSVALIRALDKVLPAQARKKMVAEIGPRFKERTGGYTRIIKIARRNDDDAAMAIIELVK